MESLMESFSSTHPAQLGIICGMAMANAVALYLINRCKRRQHEAPQFRWTTRRNAFWALIATCVAASCFLDFLFPIDGRVVLPVKSYVFAFPLGLLDLYFSDTNGVPLKVMTGATLWCSTVILRQLFVDAWFGTPVDTLVFVTELTPLTPLLELTRYVVSLLGVGLLSDLLFSPMHRMTHHPRIYKHHHKSHHEYTNKLTALVLYHGNLLDDFLMPFTTAIGGFFYTLLLSEFGVEGQAFSNVTGYLIVFNTLLSHSHDIRCARLLAPLPDELNFVAYHYVHHVSPANNFGLTEPSDKLWDYLLGVKTIAKLEDFAEKEDIGSDGTKKAQ